jgi:hypothetical protein
MESATVWAAAKKRLATAGWSLTMDAVKLALHAAMRPFIEA